ASAAFPRVALYFENSISHADQTLLASAASTVDKAEEIHGKLVTHSRRPAGVPWDGAASVDGNPWPVAGNDTLWLPAGTHVIEHSAQEPPLRIVAFNGDLKSAATLPGGVEFSYQTNSRAMAVLEQTPSEVQIDGALTKPQMAGSVLILP